MSGRSEHGMGRLRLLIETIESECDLSAEVCHEHDLTDDGKCALAADLRSILADLAGDDFDPTDAELERSWNGPDAHEAHRAAWALHQETRSA